MDVDQFYELCQLGVGQLCKKWHTPFVGTAKKIENVNLGGHRFAKFTGIAKNKLEDPPGGDFLCTQLILRSSVASLGAELRKIVRRVLTVTKAWVSGSGADRHSKHLDRSHQSCTQGLVVVGGGGMELSLHFILMDAISKGDAGRSIIVDSLTSWNVHFKGLSWNIVRSALIITASCLEAPPRQLLANSGIRGLTANGAHLHAWHAVYSAFRQDHRSKGGPTSDLSKCGMFMAPTVASFSQHSAVGIVDITDSNESGLLHPFSSAQQWCVVSWAAHKNHWTTVCLL